ncbi:MAG: hypothetical protein V1870_03930 [Candidatus Aenigmatarchaeota archaeon]
MNYNDMIKDNAPRDEQGNLTLSFQDILELRSNALLRANAFAYIMSDGFEKAINREIELAVNEAGEVVNTKYSIADGDNVIALAQTIKTYELEDEFINYLLDCGKPEVAGLFHGYGIGSEYLQRDIDTAFLKKQLIELKHPANVITVLQAVYERGNVNFAKDMVMRLKEVCTNDQLSSDFDKALDKTNGKLLGKTQS